MPHLNEAGEFWAEGYWRFEPGQSYELTEARLREAAKAAGSEVDDAGLKAAFWLLQHTEGEMSLSAYSKADLRLTMRGEPHAGSDAETITGTWRPRAGGVELDVEYPSAAAGQQFFFERENDYRLRIKRGDVWHVWAFERSRR